LRVLCYTHNSYNQICMHEVDQEKTAFIIDWGLYCYKVMLFRLKIVGQHTNSW